MDPNNTNQNNQPKQAINPIVIGAVVLGVLFLGGGFLLFSNKTTPSTSQSLPTPQNSPTINSVTESPAPTSADSKTYTLEEVAMHGSEKDCWMAIDDKVYNVTEFIPKHPGGKAIIGGCGKDATTLFNERPTNNKGPHPAQARAQLEKLYIGDIKQE